MLKKEVLPAPSVDLSEYEKVAKGIGYAVDFALDEQLACFLREQGHGVYPYESVERYLARQCGFFRGSHEFSSRKVWYWHTFREKDWQPEDCTIGPYQDGLRGRPGIAAQKGYDKPIPLPVLMTVRDLEAAWTDKTKPLRFFVSDFTNVRRDPDPFLAVTAGIGRRLFVIERWDEPGFRG